MRSVYSIISDRWRGIQARCGKAPGYLDVQCRYDGFWDFYWHMIELKFDGTLTIDRINPFGHYERSNVRLATIAEQARNKRIHHSATRTAPRRVRKPEEAAGGDENGYRIQSVIWHW
jgi:hypothetical protein